MLSGTRGAKYGLQLPGGRKGNEVKSAGLKGIQAKKPAIFAEESDEEDVESEIARQAAKKRSDKELEQQHAAALKEDPNVFDYDGVYDQMKQAQAKPAQQQQAQRQPRYITGLLKKAKEREKAQEMVMERKIQKEQAAEAHLYGDKEKFVTGAYKRKLAEDAKWQEEERRREEMEKANEVSNKTDLSDFYRNLLNKNEAFGAGARAIYAPAREETPNDADVEQADRGDHGVEASQGPKQGPNQGPEPHSAAASGSPKDERIVERGLEQEPLKSISQENTNLDDEEGAEPERGVLENSLEDNKVKEASKEGKGSDQKMASKVDAVSAAKARYLARKKQKL